MPVPAPMLGADMLCVDGAGRRGGPGGGLNNCVAGGGPGGGLNDCVGGGSDGGLNDCAGRGGPDGRLYDSERKCAEESGGIYVADCDWVREWVSEGWRGGARDVKEDDGFCIWFTLGVDGCRGGGRNSKRDCDCMWSPVALMWTGGPIAGTGVVNGAGGGADWKGRCGPNSMVASP